MWEHRPRQEDTEGALQDADGEQVHRMCFPGPVGAVYDQEHFQLLLEVRSLLIHSGALLSRCYFAA